MYDFLQQLAPHLTRRLVDRAGHAATPADVDALFADVELPVYK
jgi:LysR family cys regulon transcriptional activator